MADEIPEKLSYDGRTISTTIVHIPLRPINNNLNANTVTFEIPNDVGESYLNLKDTKILLTCAIQKASGTKLKGTDRSVLPSNNCLASLIDNVQVSIKNTIVSTQDISYSVSTQDISYSGA